MKARHFQNAAAFVCVIGAGLGVAQGCGGEPSVTPAKRSTELGSGGAGEASGGGGGSHATGAAGGTTGGTGVTGGRSGIIVGDAGQAGAGAGASGADNCGATALEAAPPRVNVLLVVDKSSSMSITAEFPDGRWAALGAALGAALDQTQARLSYGLELFPFASDPGAVPSRCETPTDLDVLVPIGAGDKTVPAIEKALAQYDPAGGTPTADALAHALDYFETGAGKDLDGTSYVLLATDGGPNCNGDLTCDATACVPNIEDANATTQCMGNCCDAAVDDRGPLNCLDEDRTVAKVRDLAKAGVKTFVVGIPGSQFFASTLDKLAQAGQVPNPDAPPSYYAVTAADGAQGLTDVLTRITRGLITSCRLQLTSTPGNAHYETLLNVVIDGDEVPQAGADGWTVDRTTTPPTIVLAGKTCDYMEEHGAERVQITYGCPTVTVR
ncbi:MAG TPA: vWA domain-containing protein [Polyangiaceae bacterium]|nr:vWA domain-containing protein [Polyangiaceae bacterium]